MNFCGQDATSKSIKHSKLTTSKERNKQTTKFVVTVKITPLTRRFAKFITALTPI
jgi:hypothetical protein